MRLPLLVLLAALPAFAGQRISVTAFSGPGAATPRNQLLEALCGDFDCAPPATVTTKNKPDWKKASREQVDFFLVGKTSKVKKKVFLELTLWSKPKKPAFKKKYELSGPRLAAKTLSQATKDLRKILGKADREPVAEALPPPPPVEEETKPTETDATSKDPGEQSSLSDTSSRGDRVAKTDSDDMRSDGDVEVVRKTQPRPRTEGSLDPLFAIDLGTDLFTRNFNYTNLQTPNLRTYQANLVVLPRARLELYPLWFAGGTASALGIEGSYGTAVGLSSRRVDGPTHATSLTRFDVAARFNLRFFGSDGAVFYPLAGYRQATFQVSAAEDGSVLDGLPGLEYKSAFGGLGFDVPLAEGAYRLFGRAAYLSVLSSGEILSSAYFPVGSTSGLEASIGAGIKLADGLELRINGELTRYGLTFQAQEGATYVASGAQDMYLGGALSLRYAFGS